MRTFFRPQPRALGIAAAFAAAVTACAALLTASLLEVRPAAAEGARARPVRDPAAAARLERGRKLFEELCAPCHGKNGEEEITRSGKRLFYDEKKFGKLKGKKFSLRKSELDRAEMEKTIRGGSKVTRDPFKDPDTGEVEELPPGPGDMPANNLKPEDLQALLDYIESLRRR